MKFSKDQIQKIVLGVLMLFGLVYCYFEYMIGPLNQKKLAARKSTEALAPEISKAKGQISRIRGYQAQAPAARTTIAQVDAMIPEGAPVAWFPSRLAEYFKKNGIERVTTRLTTEKADAALTGYKRTEWSVELPKADFTAMAAAVAALENGEPLVEFTGVTIDANAEDPAQPRVGITASTIVK